MGVQTVRIIIQHSKDDDDDDEQRWSQIHVEFVSPLSGQLLDVSGVSARIPKGEFLVSDHLNCSQDCWKQNLNISEAPIYALTSAHSPHLSSLW